MNLRTLFYGLAISATIASPALADIKLVQVTLIKSPGQEAMMKRMSPAGRAMAAQQGMGAPVRSVSYISGSHIRVETQGYVTLADSKAHTMTMLNPATHQYSTSTFDPAGSAVAATQAQVTKTSKVKSLLGHPSTLYHVVLQNLPGAGTAKADVWAANDLPQPPSLAANGPAAALMSAFHKIHGMPLLVTVVANTPYGAVTVTSTVKSLVVAPISASEFRIPAGYKAAPAGAGVGGPMMMGR